ncbi:MAG: hypothetical protein O3C63_07485 [Cyanobacteria bacterium]|nr:hypothetical protein [Cyanobacteriota bacterium]MDA1021470.1 hypothetical protein [Cyanobacteriota bacterium]
MQNNLLYFTYAITLALSLAFSPALASGIKNYEILETIKIPEGINSADFDFKKNNTVSTETDSYRSLEKSQKRKKPKNKICKKFGPLEFNFKVNPFNLNRTGIVLDIDLLESFDLFASKPNMQELKTSMQASANHNIINNDVKANYSKIKTWLSAHEAT